MKKSTNQILKETVVALGGTIDENDVSTGDAYKKLAVALGGEVSEDGSSLDALSSIGKALPEAAGGSGGGVPQYYLNNPNCPNAYYGMVVGANTKFKINLPKWIEWITNYCNKNNITMTYPYDTTVPVPSSGSGSGGGPEIYNRENMITFTIIYDMDINNPEYTTSYVDIYFKNNSIYINQESIYTEDGLTMKELCLKVGTIEAGILYPPTYDNQMIFVSGFAAGSAGGNIINNPDLNEYPIDWLEIVNE